MENLERDRIERAVRQRAYDDGYEDGRLDVNREHEDAIARLWVRLNDYEQNYVPNMEEELAMHKAYASDLEAEIVGWVADRASLQDQVDYWRNEFNRVNAILALQIEQAGDACLEAYNDGYDAGQSYILDNHGE